MVKEISVEGRDKLRIVIEKKKDCELSAFTFCCPHNRNTWENGDKDQYSNIRFGRPRMRVFRR